MLQIFCVVRIAGLDQNCKKTTCKGYIETSVVNESDVKQTKINFQKLLSSLRNNW